MKQIEILEPLEEMERHITLEAGNPTTGVRWGFRSSVQTQVPAMGV